MTDIGKDRDPSESDFVLQTFVTSWLQDLSCSIATCLLTFSVSALQNPPFSWLLCLKLVGDVTQHIKQPYSVVSVV